MRRGVVLFHSLVPCFVAGVVVLTVFSGGLDAVFRQLRDLLLLLWRLILAFFALFDHPPEDIPFDPVPFVLPEELQEAVQRQPPGRWVVLLLGGGFVATFVVLLILQLIELLRIRLKPTAPVYFGPSRRF
jgi:hypothetical protein